MMTMKLMMMMIIIIIMMMPVKMVLVMRCLSKPWSRFLLFAPAPSSAGWFGPWWWRWRHFLPLRLLGMGATVVSTVTATTTVRWCWNLLELLPRNTFYLLRTTDFVPFLLFTNYGDDCYYNCCCYDDDDYYDCYHDYSCTTADTTTATANSYDSTSKLTCTAVSWLGQVGEHFST